MRCYPTQNNEDFSKLAKLYDYSYCMSLACAFFNLQTLRTIYRPGAYWKISDVIHSIFPAKRRLRINLVENEIIVGTRKCELTRLAKNQSAAVDVALICNGSFR